jgi:hypothetical protein
LLFLDEEPVIGQTAAVSLKKLADVLSDKTPTKLTSPINGETLVFRLKKIKKKDFAKFKELVFYYAQTDEQYYWQRQSRVSMKVG